MKKWDLRSVELALEKISDMHGDEFSIPVIVNSRITRVLGRVTYRWLSYPNRTIYPEKLEISKQLLEHATDDTILGVILHEWAHYYLAKTTKINHGHDKVFKQLCASIGTWGTTMATTYELKKPIKYKYETFCKECGKRTGRYQRATNKTQHPEQYHSGCCGAGIRVVKNN